MKRLIFYLIGITLVGIGINMLIQSDKGLDPWGVFNVTLADFLSISLGTFYIYCGIFFVVVNAIIQKKLPDFFGMVTSFLMGISIDFFEHFVTKVSIPSTWIEFFVGLCLFCLGIALYFHTHLPKSPVDDLILSTQRLTHKSFKTSKVILDSAILICGLLMGGQIGLGTIVMVVLVGPLISIFIKFLEEKDEKNNLSRFRRYAYPNARKL